MQIIINNYFNNSLGIHYKQINFSKMKIIQLFNKMILYKLLIKKSLN